MLHAPSDTSVAAFLALGLIGLVCTAAWWVYQDAKEQAATGTPVVYSAGPLHIDTPVGWFLACALLLEFFVPAYLDSRRFA